MTADPPSEAPLPGPLPIDAFAMARDGRQASGSTPIARLARLAASLQPTSDAPLGALAWSLAGSVGPDPRGVPSEWIELAADFDAPMRCMRCLETVVLPIAARRLFRLERDERAVEAEPLDEDAFDLLLGSPRLDALALVEDEALLALPLSPRHEDCALPTDAAGQPVRAAEPPHPFAALAALRRPSGAGED